ncbi:MAG: hypothetical protein ACK4KT_03770 [Thermaurantimonas sp.]
MNWIRVFFILTLVNAVSLIQAREIPGLGSPKKRTGRTLQELCAPATAQADLNLNNVRATVLAAGDMWWNLNQPRYEVPKGSNRHSMFAGALWLGGLDEGNQLKLGAMTYRQRGNDYWPGPLSNDGLASVNAEICRTYDRFWIIFRSQVEKHRGWLQCKDDPDCDLAAKYPNYENEIPTIIRDWPGNGINGELDFRLAPFIDLDGNDLYDHRFDYPAYDLDRVFDCRIKEIDLLYGDMTIWWVYNDRGNIHTETQAGALGFEIRAQAFAFSTNDEINNMTFYNYRILNKSTFRLTNTFFGTWFDADLGNPFDDIIGCDIARGLGYVYNAEPVDAGPLGYGPFPPAIGLDFFQGPFADYFDGIDNDRDGCVDGVRDDFGICQPEDPSIGRNERIIMSGFMYYNNTGSPGVNPNTTDPRNAAEFYQYLQCIWRNGNPLVIENPSGRGNTNNGDGFTVDGSGERTFFAYPGLSFDTTGAYKPDEPLPNGGWWESPANKADKRGLHCAGPFSLAPGALNFITTGAVWARNFFSDDLFASMELVIIADDKAQKLFDNCFQLLDGPDGPRVDMVELDRELILNLVYDETSNNFNLKYRQRDPLIPDPPNATPQEIQIARDTGYYDYKFEGFQIFQLKDANVSVADLYNPSLSRLVAQCDIRNQYGQLINYTRDASMNALVPQDMTIQANNNGIRMSFRILEDAFATGTNRRLINHKEYFFIVVAYAVNQFAPFDPAKPEQSQQTPFLAGRRTSGAEGIVVFKGIPRITKPEQNGLILGANYGDSPEIIRYEGLGNMGKFLDLRPDIEEKIVNEGRSDELAYLPGFGPLDIKVVDPKRVPAGDFDLRVLGVGDTARWVITGGSLANPVFSDTTLSFPNEQIIPELGLSVSLSNFNDPGRDWTCSYRNGVVGSQVVYTDPNKAWLSGISDNTSFTPRNWIAVGTNTVATQPPANLYPDQTFVLPNTNITEPMDPCRFFATFVDGTWAPYTLARTNTLNLPNNLGMGPARAQTPRRDISLVRSINIVITSDRSKWTRVPVFELCEEPALAIGGANKFELRKSTSLSLVNGQLVEDSSIPQGWSFFPGYAIDVETGRRLHMAFGENSFRVGQRGNDMRWNPTSEVQDKLGNFVFGGQHYVYVFAADGLNGLGQPLDLTYSGNNPQDFPLFNEISNLNSPINRAAVFRNIDWVNIPVTAPGFNVDPNVSIPSEVTIKLRVSRSFANYSTSFSNNPNGNNGNPMYKFSTNSIAARTNDMQTAKNALDLIGVVPNPYFAYSVYETSQLDNRVKIINLPVRCNINIFTTNGELVRTITKDNTDTWVEWDLRNNYGIPIASGMYIIHVDAFGIGHKVVKWFGAMRPVDLNAF